MLDILEILPGVRKGQWSVKRKSGRCVVTEWQQSLCRSMDKYPVVAFRHVEPPL